MNTSALFSSATDDWATPQVFYDQLHLEFGFTTDVCASKENAKCSHFYDVSQDGLKQDWTGACWMNPPYGRTIGECMKKARETAQAGQATVVCLVPARTDTAWWHDYARFGEIRFVRGRLKFGNATTSAPFPSAIVIFRASVQDHHEELHPQLV